VRLFGRRAPAAHHAPAVHHGRTVQQTRPPPTPGPANWELLGQLQVSLGAANGMIAVSGHGHRFRSVRLQVPAHGMRLMNIRAHFGNGTTQGWSAPSPAYSGPQMDTLDFPTGSRHVHRVSFRYQDTGGHHAHGQTTVRLFGRRAAAHPVPVTVQPAAPTRPQVLTRPVSPTRPQVHVQPASPARPQVRVQPVVPAAQPNWELLGERRVSFRADHDVIPVGIRDGRFRRIQLRVRGNAVHMMDLRVNFANGTTYDVPIRSNIAAGGQTRAIDLPGDLRVIRNVRMTYRSRTRRLIRGHATVRLFGSHR
jgi:hypothetical protein